MHFHCECMVNNVEVEEPHSREFQQARAIYAHLLDMGLQPWRSELSMYSSILQCAGQADLIMRWPDDGSLVIVDWKRTKQLVYENRFACLKYPLSNLPDTNYWLYALKLNTSIRSQRFTSPWHTLKPLLDSDSWSECLGCEQK